MPQTPIEVECPTCKGAGSVPLDEHLAETLKIVSRIKQGAPADKVHQRIKDEVGLHAINNRLEKLRALKLLERRRVGKFWYYFRPNKNE